MKTTSLLKKIIALAVLAGATLSVNAASSKTTHLGAASVGSPLSFNSGVVPVGEFSDYFTFTLPANHGSGYSVINFAVTDLFNTLLATVSLYSNVDGTLFNADDTLLSSTGVNSGNQLALTFGPSAASSYYLNVTGMANGTQGGLYNGAISVTAVPEPENHALLLAGLGLMGAIARRRSRKSADLPAVMQECPFRHLNGLENNPEVSYGL